MTVFHIHPEKGPMPCRVGQGKTGIIRGCEFNELGHYKNLEDAQRANDVFNEAKYGLTSSLNKKNVYNEPPVETAIKNAENVVLEHGGKLIFDDDNVVNLQLNHSYSLIEKNLLQDDSLSDGERKEIFESALIGSLIEKAQNYEEEYVVSGESIGDYNDFKEYENDAMNMIKIATYLQHGEAFAPDIVNKFDKDVPSLESLPSADTPVSKQAILKVLNDSGIAENGNFNLDEMVVRGSGGQLEVVVRGPGGSMIYLNGYQDLTMNSFYKELQKKAESFEAADNYYYYSTSEERPSTVARKVEADEKFFKTLAEKLKTEVIK